jgi:copper homeostasis protein
LKPRITLEIAVDCAADAAAAVAAGADRLELCSDLAGHGYTPDVELVRAAARITGASTVAMVRPRGMGPGAAGAAGFVYGREEWSLVMTEAERLLATGAGGVVFGALDPDGSLNRDQVRQMVVLAAGRETVFHRAIDLTLDPIRSAQQLADLGVTRVLTSGMSLAGTAGDLNAACGSMTANSAAAWQTGGDAWPRRLERITEMVRVVAGRIQVLPGGGIRAANAAEVLKATGCSQVHSSGRIGGKFDAAAVAGLRASIDAAR